METLINVYKRSGETPLERLDRLRMEHPEYKDAILSYAGRLDPLAEGVMLVLVGDEANKKRAEYLGLDKDYTFDVLIGVSTDTYDLLGLVTDFQSPEKLSEIFDEKYCRAEVAKFKGKIKQEYPAYSSKTVKGKPLFQWAREGRLSEITMPTNEVEIYDIEITKFSKMSVDDLKTSVKKVADSVRGDFRQKEILAKWNETLARVSGPVNSAEFPVISLRVSCSSGTYVRSIANSLGKTLGCGAVVMNIKRERAGDYNAADSLQ